MVTRLSLMNNITDYPLLVLAVAFFALWLSSRIGSSILKKRRKLEEDMREDFGVIQGATLTLLGLIIGFTFSMAIGRYEERKNYEEAEANAIGTEYVRAGLLPGAAAARGDSSSETWQSKKKVCPMRRTNFTGKTFSG